jgi:Nif11 domain
MTTISLNKAQTTSSLTNLEQFFQEVLSNPVLQEKLKAVTDLESLSQLAVELGEEHSYHFSTEEVQAATAVETAVGSLWRAELDSRVKTVNFDSPDLPSWTTDCQSSFSCTIKL